MKSSFYLLIFTCLLTSCSPSVKGILKNLGQKNYSKAKILLDKRQQKNPNDVASLYGYALYFSDSSNTQFDIDKAYRSIQRSGEMYHLANAKIVLQLQKRHINASTLLSFQKQLEQRAFLYFKKINTEQGFQDFINRFAQAPQASEAILERNKLAFITAQKQNTYSAYKLFFEKYPDAKQVRQAQKKYEDLLFENKTKDGSLNSFVNFLKEHPKTPYRKLVERKIYELSITKYELSEYKNFVKEHPQNPYCQRAYQWIWHWNKDKKSIIQEYPQLAQNQELRQKLALEKSILYPKEQNSKLVFEDNTGINQVKTDLNYENFHRFNTKKQSFERDIFIFKNSLNEFMAIDKSGKKIVGTEDQNKYNSIKVLHSSLLKVRKGDKYAIFHKGGFQVSDFEFEQIDFVNDKVLKFKKNNRWGLITPNNKTILHEKHQRISIFANRYLKLERGNEVGFADLEGFEFKKDNLKNVNAEFTFFDKRTFSISHNQYLEIHKNNRFGISTPTGKTILYPSAEKIVETSSGWAAYFRNEWRFYSFWGKQTFANRLKDIKINAQNKSLTYAVKRDDVWAILDTQFRQKTGFSYEKIDFIPHGAILENKHGKFLYLGKKEANNYISIQNYTSINVFAFKKQHLIVVQDSTTQMGLLNQRGEIIFNCQYQNLKPLNDETILFNQNNKKGLISLDSTVILPADYDAIANTQEGYFSLLKNGKLGLFDLENRKFIPCQYTVLIQVLDKKRGVLIAKKEKFGLINVNNQVITPFIFDEIREANQDLIKVKHQNQWKYYNFVSKKFEKL